MSTLTPNPALTCRRCSRPLAPGALACDNCHALVHAAEMDSMAAQARDLESQGRLLEAHTRWMAILPLLPPDSKQAIWIRDHARELQSAPPPPPGARPKKSGWGKWLGPLAPLAVALAKFKGLLLAIFKLKFLFSFFSFIALYWALWGAKFGIGFAMLILIHEMGHFVDVKRRGLPADMPVFLPGLGAYVRWQAMGVSAETRAAIALAGPAAGWLASAVCAMVWYQTREPFWAALARVGAWYNVLNLIPVWIFDGAQAAQALRKTECVMLLVAASALGYATHEGIFYFVAAGSLWPMLKSVIAARPQPQPVTLGLAPPPPTINISTGPVDIAAGRHESHGIAAYFLVVLAALALILWLMPGHGNGLTP